jgi:hypothetical protein
MDPLVILLATVLGFAVAVAALWAGLRLWGL